MGKTEYLSNEEIIKKIELYRKGNKKSLELIVKNYYDFLHSIANNYSDSNIEHEDLVSIGSIGLIKAINAFDKDKEIKFITYAARCINNQILMVLRKDKKDISNAISINEYIDQEDEIEINDILMSDDNVEDRGERILINNDLKEALSCLTEKERSIITLRYFNIKKLNQKEIADIFGYSRSSICKIEQISLKKLKKYLVDKKEYTKEYIR